MLRVLLFSATSVAALLCDDGIFCNGVSLPTVDGKCSPTVVPCDDSDPDTDDFCDETTKTCSHKLRADFDKTGASTCKVTCTPVCKDKECGEDGCGGFCGSCQEGQGCLQGKCTAGVLSGTCSAPFNLGGTDGDAPVIETDDRVTITTKGDTGTSAHVMVPSCNTLTAAPELVYRFRVKAGQKYGYDIRVTGYDTVVELMKDKCTIANSVACSDDATPPGRLGSRIQGFVTEGTYYVLVDGYSSVDFGPFELFATFIKECEPLCDGNFCGDDSCGGKCGDCGTEGLCAADLRCYPKDCKPQCGGRECGEDGCGGSCGTCSEGTLCAGSKLLDEDDNATPSKCEVFAKCDHFNPRCSCASSSEICGSDCKCYTSLKDMPDFVVVEEHLLEESFLQDVNVPATSCALIEGCVSQPGMRRLLRFTSSGLNQGLADFAPPEPKKRPDLFEYGACHQHYHYKDFATYKLLDVSTKQLVLGGKKYAYCMEDTAGFFPGPSNVQCSKKYDCGLQGVQKGWVDSYGYSLDCSWIDVTDISPGRYILEVAVNPSRNFQEISFDNNVAQIVVTIPQIPMGTQTTILKLTTERLGPHQFVEEPLDCQKWLSWCGDNKWMDGNCGNACRSSSPSDSCVKWSSYCSKQVPWMEQHCKGTCSKVQQQRA